MGGKDDILCMWTQRLRKELFINQLAQNTKMEIVDTGPLIRGAYTKFNQENLTFGEWMKKMRLNMEQTSQMS